VPLWQDNVISVLVSRAIVEEYLRVLSYPKFKLSEGDIKGLIQEELLPYVEVVKPGRRLRVVDRDQSMTSLLNAQSREKQESLFQGTKTYCPLAVIKRFLSNLQHSFSKRTRNSANL
jgi:predicted nucleic acid-binding protein